MTSCGLVLAAGSGSRFGMPKVLAEEGRWLAGVVSALRIGGCDEVIVVLGAVAVDVPDGARSVHNDGWSTGMGGSLRVGLHACSDTTSDFVVVMPVDTPDVGSDVIARVLAAASHSPSLLARAWYGDAPGHPVVLGRRWWDAAASSAVGDEGARGFLAGRDDVHHVQCGDLATGRDHDFSDDVQRF